MSRNIAIFVDVANVFYAAKAAGVDIDYVTLLKTLTANRDLVRAYAYTGLDPDNDNQKAFHNFLARNNYKVVSKDVRKYGDGRFKANLDIELVVDLVRLAPKLDIAVVISGDGDFAPAIRAVQDMGVRVEVVSFRANTSSDLVEVADQFIEITSIAKVEAGSRSGRRVAAEGEEDLSMTEVPNKQSEEPARGPRGGRDRDRDRGGRGRRGTGSGRTGARSSTIRVGGSVLDADAIETLTIDDLEPGEVDAVASSPRAGGEGAGDGRRRRRRGGRGRRGRGGAAADYADTLPTGGGVDADGDEIEVMTLDDLDDAPRSIRPAARPAARPEADDAEIDGDVSPEVAALLRSQLAATGRSADDTAAIGGKEAPAGRGRGAKSGSRGAKPAGRAAKPAARGGKPAAKPAAKVALKKPASRAKPKGSKGA